MEAYFIVRMVTDASPLRSLNICNLADNNWPTVCVVVYILKLKEINSFLLLVSRFLISIERENVSCLQLDAFLPILTQEKIFFHH